ncbi:MAG: TonB-dependent receptor [Pseudomonadota bacterium]
MKMSRYGSVLLLTTALSGPFAFAQEPEDAEQQEQTPDPRPEIDISGPPGGLEEIIVRGRFIPNEVKANPVAISVLSQEQIERTGDGDIAGALQRVTGLSLVGGRFVYVRGLGERYSSALLNGLPLPSPEPLRRVVPLDLFPTNIIASSVVQKTYSPSYPGEFGGGAINLTTKRVPDEPFFEVSATLGGNTETTGELGYTYFGSDTDWTGFDSGTRDVPESLAARFDDGVRISNATVPLNELQTITASLQNASTTLIQRNENIPVDWSFELTGARAFDVGDDIRLGLFGSFSYSNMWRTRGGIQQTGRTNQDAQGVDRLEFASDYRYLTTQNTLTVNGILGFNAEIGDHVIRFTNIYIRDTLKEAQIRNGFTEAVDIDPVTGFDGSNENARLLESSTAWYERQLIDTQLVTELDFDQLSINLRATYAEAQRDAPYERSDSYRFNASVDDFVNFLGLQQGTGAFLSFSELTDEVIAGGLDVGYDFDTSRPLKATVGYSYYDNSRDAVRREFEFLPNDGNLPIELAQQRIDFLLSDFNVFNNGIVISENTPPVNQGSPLYTAELVVHAAYLQIEAELFDAFTVSTGVRYEDAEQTVTPLALFAGDEIFLTPDENGNQLVNPTDLNNDYFLPALTATWNFYEDMQLRFGVSKTIARPQFRELAPQFYNDPDLDRGFQGNAFLFDTELLNFDIRYEWYFGRDETFSISGFYKSIDNPIEQVVDDAEEDIVVRFANAPKARLFGGEIEYVKFFDLYELTENSFFQDRRVYLNVNYTYTDSSLIVDDTDSVVNINTTSFPDGFSCAPVGDDLFDPNRCAAATRYFRDGAPLTGQSTHLANLQIGLEHPDYLSQQTLILNYASERVSIRGNNNPDVVEKPGVILDFVARQGIEFGDTMVEVKLEARNLLNADFQEFVELNDSRLDINRYERGRSFALSVSARF